MKLLFIGTHVDQTTGYSKVVYNLLEHMSKIAKVYHFGFQRHPNKSNIRTPPKSVSVYDVAANVDPVQDSFGYKKVGSYIKTVKPDVIMIYNDPIVSHFFMEEIKKTNTKAKVWVYLDQLYNGINPTLVTSINRADRIYTFTEDWAELWKKYDPKHPEVKTLHHAVDPKEFGPIDTTDVRKNLGIPEDAIIILNANRNSGRKRLDYCIMGFAQLLRNFPDLNVYLVFVTGMAAEHGAFYDIARIFNYELQMNGMDLALESRIKVINTSPPNRLADADINKLYHVADIGINTSDGEGYGLCTLEHLFAGKPQIVTDIGVYQSFLTDDVLEYIPRHERVYYSGTLMLGFFAPTFSIFEVAKAMKRMIDNLKDKTESAKQFRFRTWAEVLEPLITDINNEGAIVV